MVKVSKLKKLQKFMSCVTWHESMNPPQPPSRAPPPPPPHFTPATIPMATTLWDTFILTFFFGSELYPPHTLPRHYPYGHNAMGYLHLNIFLGPELYLLTLQQRQVGHGNHGIPSESFLVTATAVNFVRWHNDNAFPYRFKFREKS